MSKDKDNDNESYHINYAISASKPSGHSIGGDECSDEVNATFHDKALGDALQKLLIEKGFEVWYRRYTRTDVFCNYEDE